MILVISNSNWTDLSTIQGVTARVISKSDEREARGRFEITIVRVISRSCCKFFYISCAFPVVLALINGSS